jgi:hypothetical protein
MINNNFDVFFDTSPGAAHAPPGTTGVRRISSCCLDGNGNVFPYIQWGDIFTWGNGPTYQSQFGSLLPGANWGLVGLATYPTAPVGINTRVQIFGDLNFSSGSPGMVALMGFYDAVFGGSHIPLYAPFAMYGTSIAAARWEIMTDTSANVGLYTDLSSGGAASASVYVEGYIDNRGKDWG